MFHDFINWIREDLGRFSPDGQSWSHQLHESLNMWNVIEGTHVLTIMFFAGTIWLVDLRMMGVAFRKMPFSQLNDRVLPITVVAFVAMIVTGLIAFIGRDPMMYYHNIWFRLKMLFLVVAAINIFWFHRRVQKDQAAWDAMETPPTVVRLSGAISMLCWFLIIIFGRFIAYDWYYCEKTEPGSLIYQLQECEDALWYLEDVQDEGTTEVDTTTDDATPEGNPAETTNPADEPPVDLEAPEQGAPADPATEQSAPGEEG